jgi:hypothetical protein
MNIISLTAARSRLRSFRPVAPPPVLGVVVPEANRSRADDAAEDRMRMRQNLAAMIAIAAIVGLGTWLIDSLRYYSRLQTCFEAGHRNCLPFEAKYQPSPYRG